MGKVITLGQPELTLADLIDALLDNVENFRGTTQDKTRAENYKKLERMARKFKAEGSVRKISTCPPEPTARHAQVCMTVPSINFEFQDETMDRFKAMIALCDNFGISGNSVEMILGFEIQNIWR